jgi:hypothetical protein
VTVDQLRIDGEAERLKGARRNAKGMVIGKVVIITPTTDGASLMLPGGVSGHIHRVVDGKVHINLVLDLEEPQ